MVFLPVYNLRYEKHWKVFDLLKEENIMPIGQNLYWVSTILMKYFF